MKRALALSALLIAFAVGSVHMQAQTAYQPQAWHGVLSASDQSDFDKDYAKWIEATRKGDQEDISENSSKMQAIMARYNIPSSVPFDQVASTGAPAAYPNQAYPTGYAQRLSPDDQKEFDKQYAKWVESTRKGDQEDVAESARKMQDIMARYRISAGVPFAQVASGGSAAAYPNPAYAYPAAQGQRLSSHDQHEFDEAYGKWVSARHKKHTDDLEKNARKMQDIMARYNIPA
ncbi:MAG TPA: hypothetical protein VG498_08870, partial [Terriglobales bacterium]|nr:hypothetical protein [Terriglobales bacterium]